MPENNILMAESDDLAAENIGLTFENGYHNGQKQQQNCIFDLENTLFFIFFCIFSVKISIFLNFQYVIS